MAAALAAMTISPKSRAWYAWSVSRVPRYRSVATTPVHTTGRRITPWM